MYQQYHYYLIFQVRGDEKSIFDEVDRSEIGCQVQIISTDKSGAISNPELTQKLEKIDTELQAQVTVHYNIYIC